MDAEEVVLFPDLPGPPVEAPAPTGTPPAADVSEAFDSLCTWIDMQLTMAEAVLRKHKEPAKPEGLTPAIAAYVQAREAKAAAKATREAYMKAQQKADHYAAKAGE